MASTGIEHINMYFQIPKRDGVDAAKVHPEIAPDCPCGDPMRSIGDGIYECPHDHRTDPPTQGEPTRFPDIPSAS